MCMHGNCGCQLQQSEAKRKEENRSQAKCSEGKEEKRIREQSKEKRSEEKQRAVQ